MTRAIGICYNPHYPYIDHIVPLCQLLEIPLLCSDWGVEQTIKSYYPPMQVICEPDIQNEWKPILDHYDTLVYTDFYRRFHGAFEFLDFVYSRNMRSIYCPHGNSDKGHRTFWMERFADEDITFIYGPKMKDFLKEKAVWDRLKQVHEIGNFRFDYYQKHQLFFDTLIEQELFPPWKKKEDKINLLYLPTWQSKGQIGQQEWDSSSFFMAYPFLFDHLPKDYRLFIKLHPNLYVFYKEEIEQIKEKYKNNEDIYFIEHCPLIYPLLAQVDAYIGDLSSVGYDFLTFNRPMFFLNSEKRQVENDPGLFLYRCGTEILPENFSSFYKIIENHLNDTEHVKKMRKDIWSYTFGEKKILPNLKEIV